VREAGAFPTLWRDEGEHPLAVYGSAGYRATGDGIAILPSRSVELRAWRPLRSPGSRSHIAIECGGKRASWSCGISFYGAVERLATAPSGSRLRFDARYRDAARCDILLQERFCEAGDGLLFLIQQSKHRESDSNRTRWCASSSVFGREKPKGARGTPTPLTEGVNDGGRHGRVVRSKLPGWRAKAPGESACPTRLRHG